MAIFAAGVVERSMGSEPHTDDAERISKELVTVAKAIAGVRYESIHLTKDVIREEICAIVLRRPEAIRHECSAGNGTAIWTMHIGVDWISDTRRRGWTISLRISQTGALA